MFLFCICFTISYAQPDSVVIWNKWCSRKDSMILFTKANNLIQVFAPGLKAADIKIKSIDNNLRIGKEEVKGDTISLLAMPLAAARKTRLSITDRKTGKIIRTVNFNNDSVPQPIAQVGNLTKIEVLRKDILAQLALKVIFPNSLYSYPYRIRQYTFSIHSAKGGATIPVAGPFLTKEILDEIKNAPAGTTCFFTEIKATCPECAMRALGDIKIMIK